MKYSVHLRECAHLNCYKFLFFIATVVAVELVPQRVNRRRSFSTLMLTLGDIVLVRLASNIIRYGCNGNILIFRKSSLIRYNLFNYYYTQEFTY